VANINEVEALLNDMVVPKTMQHIDRIKDPAWQEKWRAAAYTEMDGL
jgi:hypothetical protein